MKMRISEKRLTEFIKKAICEAVVLTDRKVENQNVSIGDYEQPYTSTKRDDLRIPTEIVVVSDIKNPKVVDDFLAFVDNVMVPSKDPDLDGALEPSKNFGINLFNKRLNGRVNQLYGLSKYDDQVNDVAKDPRFVSKQHQDEPFDPKRGLGDTTFGPSAKECPFEYGEDGYVRVKPGMESLVSDYLTYSDEGEQWEYATYRNDDKLSFIFFFNYPLDRQNFVRQLKNMFMIIRRTTKNGNPSNRFVTNENNQLKIEQYSAYNPLDFLDEENDSEFIQEINEKLSEQEEIVASKQEVPDEEGDTEIGSMDNLDGAPVDTADGEQPVDIADEQPPVDDEEEQNRLSESRRKNKHTVRITESKLRGIIKEAILRELYRKH